MCPTLFFFLLFLIIQISFRFLSNKWTDCAFTSLAKLRGKWFITIIIVYIYKAHFYLNLIIYFAFIRCVLAERLRWFFSFFQFQDFYRVEDSRYYACCLVRLPRVHRQWQHGVHQRVWLWGCQLFYFSSTTSPFKAVVNMPGHLAFRLVYFSIWARAPIFLSLFGCKGIIFYTDIVVWRSLYLFISYCNTALLTLKLVKSKGFFVSVFFFLPSIVRFVQICQEGSF